VKAKKAVKKLTKVETALDEVLDQFAEPDGHVRDLLETAKASVVQAKTDIEAAPAAGSAGKKARRTKMQSSKKGSTSVKRKGVDSVAGRDLSATA